jgi:hypothetical protein
MVRGSHKLYNINYKYIYYTCIVGDLIRKALIDAVAVLLYIGSFDVVYNKTEFPYLDIVQLQYQRKPYAHRISVAVALRRREKRQLKK